MNQSGLTALLAVLFLSSSLAFAVPLDRFTVTANAAISGHNIEQLSNVSPDQCAASCLDSSRSQWCVSFDYYKGSNKCDLSNKNAQGVGGLKTNYPGNPYDHYSLISNPIDSFIQTPNAAIYGHNNEHLTQVTPEQCAEACTGANRSYWCQSFDYYKEAKACDLSDKRATDVGDLKTDYPNNPYNHYSRISGEAPANPIPGNKHVLLIGLDGLRGDSIQCNSCAETPNMDALIEGGAFHDNVLAGGQQVTVSGPGWASVFTGYWDDDHGITSNSTSLKLGKPHVFDLIRQSYPTATSAVVADWVNLTTNLLPENVDYVYGNNNKDSQQATDKVIEWLSWEHAPSAIFYYLHNIDIHTSSYDPDSAYYQAAIEKEDQQIGQVLNALSSRPNYASEEWLIVVTSDHGGLGSGHGGQSAEERNTFVILNNNYSNPAVPAYCLGNLNNQGMTQVDSAAPHIIDFLGLDYQTAGSRHPACGY
ncbi:PAN domain-containing protein [Endozoicomonas lisbonensis]|uniref:Apple domain-containing protein n=1 Tax=Endozoicomonas lisbonensis TaxID=3120522 RepID=A0ABV2SEV0_9GAMM